MSVVALPYPYLDHLPLLLGLLIPLVRSSASSVGASPHDSCLAVAVILLQPKTSFSFLALAIHP